ncbi:MAG TPA: CapA family protein [Propionibacteriaceae bacterium]|nr:CapA family protein [Propionibacteriaceae bacterium]
MPLALVVNATRRVRDVPLRQARRLVASGASSWSQISQGPGRLQVLRVSEPSNQAWRARVRADTSALAVVPAAAVDGTVRVLTVDGRHPLRQPESYPLTVRWDRPQPTVTTLTAVGDIMLARRVGQAMRAADDPALPFRPLANRLASAEITVGNFESSLSRDGRPSQGGDSFGADPSAIQALRMAGIDLVSLANNHLGDYGDSAMRTTFDRFASSGVHAVGAGTTLAAARRPVILQRDGTRVGFLATDSIGETPAATATTAGTNRLDMPPRTGPLDRADLRRITEDIETLSRQVDVVVVMTHWGTQYTHRPEPSQRTAARAFAAAGADLVIGGHPHWVQGWELIGSTITVHSLGNFVFDMDFSSQTQQGVFVEIVLWNGAVKAVEPVPYTIGSDFAPRLASGDRADAILNDVWRFSRGPFQSR